MGWIGNVDEGDPIASTRDVGDPVDHIDRLCVPSRRVSADFPRPSGIGNVENDQPFCPDDEVGDSLVRRSVNIQGVSLWIEH